MIRVRGGDGAVNFLRSLQVVFALLAVCGVLASCGDSGTQGKAPNAGDSQKTEKPERKSSAADPEAVKGKLLFAQLGCNTCHMHPTTGAQYPDLRGLYGKTIRLTDGSTARVDDEYLYESIKESNKRIVAGYSPAMPSFAHLKDDQVKALIAYIKSLKDEKPVFVKPESFVSEESGTEGR
jgi:cytochrome c5